MQIEERGGNSRLHIWIVTRDIPGHVGFDVVLDPFRVVQHSIQVSPQLFVCRVSIRHIRWQAVEGGGECEWDVCFEGRSQVWKEWVMY